MADSAADQQREDAVGRRRGDVVSGRWPRGGWAGRLGIMGPRFQSPLGALPYQGRHGGAAGAKPIVPHEYCSGASNYGRPESVAMWSKSHGRLATRRLVPSQRAARGAPDGRAVPGNVGLRARGLDLAASPPRQRGLGWGLYGLTDIHRLCRSIRGWCPPPAMWATSLNGRVRACPARCWSSC